MRIVSRGCEQRRLTWILSNNAHHSEHCERGLFVNHFSYLSNWIYTERNFQISNGFLNFFYMLFSKHNGIEITNDLQCNRVEMIEWRVKMENRWNFITFQFLTVQMDSDNMKTNQLEIFSRNIRSYVAAVRREIYVKTNDCTGNLQ